MNKKELVDVVAAKTGFLKKDVMLVIDETFNSVKETMSKGDKVAVSGFGSFLVKERKARVARNPKTGESIDVPAKNAPVFKASSALKEAV